MLRVKAPTGGGGDAVVVADSSGARPWHALLDAGGDSVAAVYLREAGIDTLDLMVLTHAHQDHYGGMGDVFDEAHVVRFVYNGQVRSLASYQAVLDAAHAMADTVLIPTEALRIPMSSSAAVTILPPLDTWLAVDTDDGEEINEGSLAVRVSYADFSFLSTGDAEHRANQRFAAAFPAEIRAAVLKVGHHGSSDATSASWLEAVDPQAAVVSANGTTHPHGSALELLRARTADLFCTPNHGTVSVRVGASGDWDVRTAQDPRKRCTRGTEAF